MTFEKSKGSVPSCICFNDKLNEEWIEKSTLGFGDICTVSIPYQGYDVRYIDEIHTMFYILSKDRVPLRLGNLDFVIPSSITKHIEEPHVFYESIEIMCRDKGYPLFVELDHEAHAGIIKTFTTGDYSKYRLKYGIYKKELLYKTEISNWHLVKDKKIKKNKIKFNNYFFLFSLFIIHLVHIVRILQGTYLEDSMSLIEEPCLPFFCVVALL
jgi:hypothetical protein